MTRLRTVLLFISFFTSAAWCQEQAEADDQTQIAQAMEIVYSARDFRFRSNDSAPKLVYGKEFFQRFEPVSVGDMLKRLPGMSGSADAGEFDQPQLRGIGPQYTQILINGRRLPGLANDHTLLVDRIPANLVERLEISRSPSAHMDAQGIAGTINIVLKPADGVAGVQLLLGMTHFERDETY